MFQGYYNLASGMLTQNRKLNVISNNMANVSTPGFKSEQFVATTFREEMIYRSGNKDKSGAAAIGTMNRIVTADENVNNYTPTAYESTGNGLDFALQGNGFFSIQTPDGIVYTRNGSFILDTEGYIAMQGVGRVLGLNGPIRADNTKIATDSLGNIYSEATNEFLGRLAVVDFDDYAAQLTKTTGDVYVANGQANPINGTVVHKALEFSNVDTIHEMTEMMGSQRALQSAAQILKLYDQLTGKIVTQLGPT